MMFEAEGPAGVDLQAMKNEAGRILLQSGLRVQWIDCELEGRPANVQACTPQGGQRRLMLQLLPGRNRKTPHAAGMAVVQKGASVFACLYPERVRELAREADWDFPDLLGHAAAHELGHLLLESAAHSHAGVMRARWEAHDLRGLAHAGLVFLPGQLARAGARLAAEARPADGEN